MPQMTLQDAFDLAVRHHEAGQLREADSLYRQILAHHPAHADSLHLRGVLAGQEGKFREGIELISQAISIQPDAPQYLSNLGVILGNMGRHEESIAAHRQALAIYPEFTDGRSNLAAALLEAGRVAESTAEYRRLVAEHPDYPEGFNGLGNALMVGAKLDESIAMYQHAVALRPGYAEAYSNMCNALRLRGRFVDAIAAGQQAVSQRPDFPEAFNNLGTALQMNGQHDEAIAAYRQAVALRPQYAQAFYNLGAALQTTNRLDEAIDAYHKALALHPDYPEVHGNLGNALKDMGQINEALDSYRKAVALKSETRAANNLLFGIHFHESFGPKEIFEEHDRWNRMYARPLASLIKPFQNDRSPERPLRIGYVSPDFNVHPVGRFLLPLLTERDRGNFHITCYSDVAHPDWMTQRLRSLSDLWRETLGMSDEQIAGQIRADQIDILVDLTMHAEGSRLLVFARKPAPVQVTYLAYCSTTGLETMDYRLTDPYLDPPDDGLSDSYYSEKSIRLPHTYWCYQAPAEAPEVGPLPAERAGHVTFGCLNNYSKVSPMVLSTWCELLKRVPGSELIVFSREGAHRQRGLELIAKNGIELSRFHFVGPVATPEYFRRYLEFDIALDPFPYPGGTTTCDALWMGVPVVTLAGRTAVSRGGLSILSNVGLEKLVARDREQYVSIAADLAGNVPRIRDLRKTLRSRMLGLPLMDSKSFALAVQAAFREMWRTWCASSID